MESTSGYVNTSDNLDWFVLEDLYYEGCRFFVEGDYDQAIEHFKRIYEETTGLWDVADLVYALPRDRWIARYRRRMEKRLLPNKPPWRMAAGGLLRRFWMRLTTAIAHCFALIRMRMLR